MKKLVVTVLVVGAVVAVAWSGSAAWRRSHADPQQGPEVTRVARGDIASVIKATGVVRPALGAEVRVGAQVSGVVKHLFARTGDQVVRGAKLAELEPRELGAKRDQAAAALQSAEANLRFNLSDLERKRRLAGGEVIARAELDLAERAAALAEAQVAGARADLAFARAQLDETRILAPIDGVVASVTTQQGETVAAGLAAPTFLTIVDLRRLEVWAYVDETDIGRVRIEQTARFSVDAYPGEEFGGRVTAIYPRPEIRDNVVDYVAVLEFTPPEGRTLRPEMTANVRIELEARAGVLTIPRRAVRREQGRSYVLRRDARGVGKHPVTVGVRDEASVEVLEGLREGDEVVLGDVEPPSPAE